MTVRLFTHDIMNKKLTLSLDERVIKQAKLYAKENQTCVSKLVESYLSSLLENKAQEIEITPLVESLSGVVTIPEGVEVKNDYTDYLLDKYK